MAGRGAGAGGGRGQKLFRIVTIVIMLSGAGERETIPATSRIGEGKHCSIWTFVQISSPSVKCSPSSSRVSTVNITESVGVELEQIVTLCPGFHW